MKKIFLAALAVMLIGCVGCTSILTEDAVLSDSLEQEQSILTEDIVLSDTLQQQKHRVVDVLLATGKHGRCSCSVAYLLLDNGEVIVYTQLMGVVLPFTKQQAKIIMLAQCGEKPVLPS